MKFFQVSSLEQDIIKPSGIPISLMSKVFQKLGKLTKFKTVNDLSGHTIVIIDGNDKKISLAENQTSFKVDKNTSVAILNGYENLLISDKEASKVMRIFDGKLHLASSIENLNKLYSEKTINLTDEERKVYEWLDQDKGGTSSYTMLINLFPNIKHDYLEDVKKSNGFHPRDLSDFSRCVNFLNTTDGLRERLVELSSLSNEWNNLVKDWKNIEKELENKNIEEANNLFLKCVEKTNKLKM